MRHSPLILVPFAALLIGLAACGSDDDDSTTSSDGERPTVVVTTSILGDVVQNLVGDRADVQVLMPPGADPHDFQLSARQAADLREADALISNGGGFEEGFLDALESAEADGVATHEALEDVEPLEYAAEDSDAHAGEGEEDHAEGEEGGEEHADDEEGEDHTDEEGEADHAEEHQGADPHFFTDPGRMATAAEAITTFLAEEVPALDDDEFRRGAGDHIEDLEALTDEVGAILDAIPDEDRILVTNHEVFGYLADRYDFEVVGAVIPGGGTGAEPSAQELDELATTIEAEDVPAIFADVSSPQALAESLAAEVGGVEVVTLFSESLGGEGSGGATYEEMMRTNADRIVEALT